MTYDACVVNKYDDHTTYFVILKYAIVNTSCRPGPDCFFAGFEVLCLVCL